MQTNTDADWYGSARTANRQRRAAWLGTLLIGFTGIGLFVAGSEIDAPALQTGLMGIACLLLVVALVWGTVVYMRVIDEQERDANLWGCYAGMMVYLTVYGIKIMAEVTGSTVPITERGTLIATVATVLAVFAWKRFR